MYMSDVQYARHKHETPYTGWTSHTTLNLVWVVNEAITRPMPLTVLNKKQLKQHFLANIIQNSPFYC